MSWLRDLSSVTGIAAARLVVHSAVAVAQRLACERSWASLTTQRSDAPCQLVRIDSASGPKKYSLICGPWRSHETSLHLQRYLRILRPPLGQFVRSNCLGRLVTVSYRGEVRESHLVHGVRRTDKRKDLFFIGVHILHQLIRRSVKDNSGTDLSTDLKFLGEWEDSICQ